METGPFANPGQASLALRRALAAEPGNRTFRLGLMELYRQQGRLEEARVLGEEAQGGWPELRQVLALVYAELGAAGPLLGLLRVTPEEVPSARLAGLHAAARGQWDTALALLGRCLELRPEDWDLRVTHCNLLLHAHRLDEDSTQMLWEAIEYAREGAEETDSPVVAQNGAYG